MNAPGVWPAGASGAAGTDSTGSIVHGRPIREESAFIPLPADTREQEHAQKVMRRLIDGPTPEEREAQATQLAEQRREYEAKAAEGLAAWVAEMARRPSGSLAREIVSLHRPVYIDQPNLNPHLQCRGCHPWMYEDDEGELQAVGVGWPCRTYKAVLKQAVTDQREKSVEGPAHILGEQS